MFDAFLIIIVLKTTYLTFYVHKMLFKQFTELFTINVQRLKFFNKEQN